MEFFERAKKNTRAFGTVATRPFRA